MAAAAVISFEETRQSFAKTRARQQLHAYLDGWLERLEANMPDDAPGLDALTQAVVPMRRELTGQITQALVAQQHAQVLHQRTMPCPHCQCILPARPALAGQAGWVTGGREGGQGFRFYSVDQAPLVHVLRWHEVHTDEEAAAALRQVKAAGLIPEDQVRLGVLGDGVTWIWKQVAVVLRPVATKITGHRRESVYRRYALVSDPDL